MKTPRILHRTTTAEALLGILSLHAMTGYEIRQQIASSIGNFWSESFGQIYPTLKRLRREGFVEVVQQGEAEREVYRLTEPGRERLRSWLPMPPKPRVPRSELLLKLFFGNLVPAGSMRNHVVEARARGAGDLARYDGIAAEISRLHPRNPGLPFWLITVNYGRAEAHALLTWCDETLATLDELDGLAAAGERNTDESSKEEYAHAG